MFQGGAGRVFVIIMVVPADLSPLTGVEGDILHPAGVHRSLRRFGDDPSRNPAATAPFITGKVGEGVGRSRQRPAYKPALRWVLKYRALVVGGGAPRRSCSLGWRARGWAAKVCLLSEATSLCVGPGNAGTQPDLAGSMRRPGEKLSAFRRSSGLPAPGPPSDVLTRCAAERLTATLRCSGPQSQQPGPVAEALKNRGRTPEKAGSS